MLSIKQQHCVLLNLIQIRKKIVKNQLLWNSNEKILQRKTSRLTKIIKFMVHGKPLILLVARNYCLWPYNKAIWSSFNSSGVPSLWWMGSALVINIMSEAWGETSYYTYRARFFIARSWEEDTVLDLGYKAPKNQLVLYFITCWAVRYFQKYISIFLRKNYTKLFELPWPSYTTLTNHHIRVCWWFSLTLTAGVWLTRSLSVCHWSLMP